MDPHEDFEDFANLEEGEKTGRLLSTDIVKTKEDLLMISSAVGAFEQVWDAKSQSNQRMYLPGDECLGEDSFILSSSWKFNGTWNPYHLS